MFCEKCGTKIEADDALFCPKCGNKIADNSFTVQVSSNEVSSVEVQSADTDKQKKTTKTMAITAGILAVAALVYVLAGNVSFHKESGKISQKTEEISNDDKEYKAEDNKEPEAVKSQDDQLVVEDIYISKLSEIPNDLMEQMKAQTSDNITAYSAGEWEDDVKLADAEYIGAYLLKKKDNSNTEYENILYVVYAVTAEIKTNSGKEKNVTSLYYTSFYNLSRNDDGTVNADLSVYTTPNDSFFVGVSDKVGYGGHYFRGYENVDALHKNLVLKNVDKYTYDGDIQYEMPANGEYTQADGQNLNAEFGIDASNVVDYSANLDKDAFGYFDSGIADFNFRYPLHLYNNVTKNTEAFEYDYGTNEVTYTFSGNDGSKLIFALIKRNDENYTIRDMTDYVHLFEDEKMVDTSDIVNSVTDDHGKIIITGWEDSSKEFIIYDMIKVEEEYILQMKVYMTNFTDDNDKYEKSYVTECDYRYCGFSDSKYDARTYEEYLENK